MRGIGPPLTEQIIDTVSDHFQSPNKDWLMLEGVIVHTDPGRLGHM